MNNDEVFDGYPCHYDRVDDIKMRLEFIQQCCDCTSTSCPCRRFVNSEEYDKL